MDDAIPGQWDGLPLRELLRATVEVDVPAPDDQLIALHAEPERLPWMHVNLTDRWWRTSATPTAMRPGSTITAHSDRDQIARVIQRLRADRFVPDATITTLQPLTDTSYLPRVSLLHFWLEDDRLHLGVNAHGIDFGMKGYAR